MTPSKLQQVKHAMKNPPPERLAKVEYQSHFFQMVGITIVCIILIFKGFWWIIFAFIFGLGVSYSQGMSAYIKYNNIMALLKPQAIEDFEKDISPTRRRSKIINHVFGSSAKWTSLFVSVTIPLFLIKFSESRITFSLAYMLMIGLLYTLIYFFFFYSIAYPIYKKKIKINKK
ncbi:hypothetical protein LCGC14_0476690 [marine sediment metagenome]|uniref:Uncharacterized protein n=1 Tax=marine sediment metagenome TaxID=412755 RepID=A0A0F9UXN6_9ZZZZ|nr:hypothetical protein [bacterium]